MSVSTAQNKSLLAYEHATQSVCPCARNTQLEDEGKITGWRNRAEIKAARHVRVANVPHMRLQNYIKHQGKPVILLHYPTAGSRAYSWVRVSPAVPEPPMALHPQEAPECLYHPVIFLNNRYPK